MLEAKNQLKKEAEEKRQAQLKKVSEIQKQKSDLLGKLIEEQKKLILIMDEKKGTLKPEERSEMIGMLKSLSAKIDKTKEDIKAAMQVTAVKKGPADVSLSDINLIL